MALHPKFPKSPYEILDPEIRWFPADESMREKQSQLLPPLVAELRKLVNKWRKDGYVGATSTSISLLDWWFDEKHLINRDGALEEYQYYFAQREAIETIVYLFEVAGIKDKYDLIRFDSTGRVSAGMFDENWLRFVVKMATGSGKTKVLSLVIAWSYFNKLYEANSPLSRNFLIITPNIIVLDRLRRDFEGLRIFFEDPILPIDGYGSHNWRNDFQLSFHLQDDVHITRSTGNVFLTNIHRVYSGNDELPSLNDGDMKGYFLGKKPVGATTDTKTDLGAIVRDIDELMILNDEAHHIHDESKEWFKSIRDISNRLKQKGKALSLQIDTTATPKHDNGAVFVQTICDYPLVEAISQNVVKHPVLPDIVSRLKLNERQTSKFVEKYTDYIHLGVIEWRKAYDEHLKLGKKALLFIMTDDTKNCDEVAEYIEKTYEDFRNAVLVIHTKQNGEISEMSTGKNKEELEKLRKQANEIDGDDSPYKAVISVMMLKEGWDVRNVTTIVGLRAYSAKSNILPEQTLGRGLRKMYLGGIEEYVSVVGTNAFMEFVETIQAEGVVLNYRPMGEKTQANVPLIIEIDDKNLQKDIDALDIEIPLLSPRVYREYKELSLLDLSSFRYRKMKYSNFTSEEQRQIIFRDITNGNITHITSMDTMGYIDYRGVIGFFTRSIMNELRLVSGYDILYGKVKEFIQDWLFEIKVNIEDPNTLRNLSEVEVTKTILDTFKKAINELTIKEKGDSRILDTIRLREMRPYVSKKEDYLIPKKSVFNKIVGDSHLELVFAGFLDNCEDVKAYGKNYPAVNFKLDYIDASGEIIRNYLPDFIVKLKDGRLVIVETKGLADLDVPFKTERLKQWCKDVNSLGLDYTVDFVYVDQVTFESHRPHSFKELMQLFREYKD